MPLPAFPPRLPLDEHRDAYVPGRPVVVHELLAGPNVIGVRSGIDRDGTRIDEPENEVTAPADWYERWQEALADPKTLLDELLREYWQTAMVTVVYCSLVELGPATKPRVYVRDLRQDDVFESLPRLQARLAWYRLNFMPTLGRIPYDYARISAMVRLPALDGLGWRAGVVVRGEDERLDAAGERTTYYLGNPDPQAPAGEPFAAPFDPAFARTDGPTLPPPPTPARLATA
jgi:hypothetical protein